VVSARLGIPRDKMAVVDVRETKVVLDILVPSVEISKIIGAERPLLESISMIEGVYVFPETCIAAEGVLGLISLPPSEKRPILKPAEKIASNIKERLAKRIIVFPTGSEVEKKFIQDKNSPYIKSILEKEGFDVKIGRVLSDDPVAIRGAWRKASEEGFGFILTTGGIGAEEKDKTIEALLGLNPGACTLDIIEFRGERGTHPSGKVRIGMGTYQWSRILALPGPNTEVKIAMKEVIRGLKKGWGNQRFVKEIVLKLRNFYVPISCPKTIPRVKPKPYCG